MLLAPLALMVARPKIEEFAVRYVPPAQVVPMPITHGEPAVPMPTVGIAEGAIVRRRTHTLPSPRSR